MILKFNEALADCNLSLNVLPNFSKALIRKANIQFKLGRLNEAKDSFSTVKNHHPQSTGIKEQMLAIETAQLRFKRAERILSNQLEPLLDESCIIKLPNEENAKQALSEIYEVESIAINWIELLVSFSTFVCFVWDSQAFRLLSIYFYACLITKTTVYFSFYYSTEYMMLLKRASNSPT